MADLSTPSDNNTVPEMHAAIPTLILRVAGEAISFLTVGVPAARRDQSRTAESAFDAWLPVIGASASLVAVGGLAVGAIELPLVRAAGAAAALTGLLLLCVAIAIPAAIDRMAPPARRSDTAVSDAARGPLAPSAGASGLVAFGPGIHVAQMPLVFHSVAMGARMTVLDLGEAGVLVHSPIQATEELVTAVKALGEVRWIVAPNSIHHMYVGEWAERFPEARLVAAPGLEQRRSDLNWSMTLRGPAPEVPWPSDLVEASVVEGHKLLEELVLFHRPSGSLIVADLIENLGYSPETSRKQRFLLDLAASARRPAPPNDYKLTILDRSRVRVALDRIEQWPFERIVLAHGRLVEVDAKEIVADAFAFTRS